MNEDDIFGILRRHDKWRLEECINLIPSENIMSRKALGILASDFGHRYTLRREECPDFSIPFLEMIWVKSDEELVMLRHSGKIGEMACQAMFETVQPGVSESKIYAAVMKVLHENAAGTSQRPTARNELHADPDLDPSQRGCGVWKGGRGSRRRRGIPADSG